MSFNGIIFFPYICHGDFVGGRERSLCKQVNSDRCDFCLIIGTWENKWAITWACLRTSLTRPLAFRKHRSQLTFTEIRLFPAYLKVFIYPWWALPGKCSSACIHGNLCWGQTQRWYSSRLQSTVTRMINQHPMMALCDLYTGNLQHTEQWKKSEG